MAAFPMQDPQYVIYVLVLQPKPDKTTYGFTTGGFIAAPTVGRIIARIGPMLGILPATGDTLAALDASLTIPMQPTPPPGVLGLGPGHPFPPGANAFAYELVGEKPPQAPGATGQASALLSASHSARRSHNGIMAPVYPMLGNHMTRREAPADNQFAEQ
jgi:cell division protein FtsI (penicillin-binding protein 3)